MRAAACVEPRVPALFARQTVRSGQSTRRCARSPMFRFLSQGRVAITRAGDRHADGPSPKFSKVLSTSGSETAKVVVRQRLCARRRDSPMATECRQDSLDFGTVESRSFVGAFDGGVISSDAGALLLGAVDMASGETRSTSEQQSRTPHVSSAKSARSLGRNRLHCEAVTVTDAARG
jgi:hypothetical protein